MKMQRPVGGLTATNRKQLAITNRGSPVGSPAGGTGSPLRRHTLTRQRLSGGSKGLPVKPFPRHGSASSVASAPPSSLAPVAENEVIGDEASVVIPAESTPTNSVISMPELGEIAMVQWQPHQLDTSTIRSEP